MALLDFLFVDDVIQCTIILFRVILTNLGTENIIVTTSILTIFLQILVFFDIIVPDFR